MAYEIVLMPRARRQLGAAVSWWRGNRPAAPDLLGEELDRAMSNLMAFPELGRELSDPRIRVLLLPKTATIVMYRVRPRLQRIQIVRLVAARR